MAGGLCVFFDAAMHGWEWIFLICLLEAYGMKIQ